MQTSVTIHVLQGERAMAADNVSLGQFNLVGIPPAPRGIPDRRLRSDIDASRYPQCFGRNGTGKEQKMTITASTNLYGRRLKEMVTGDAKEYEEQDKAIRGAERNPAKFLSVYCRKTKVDLADKLDADVTERLNGAIIAVEAALEGRHPRNQVGSRKTPKGSRGSGMSRSPGDRPAASTAAARPAASSGEEPGGQGGERVVDADFKVNDEK